MLDSTVIPVRCYRIVNLHRRFSDEWSRKPNTHSRMNMRLSHRWIVKHRVRVGAESEGLSEPNVLTDFVETSDEKLEWVKGKEERVVIHPCVAKSHSHSELKRRLDLTIQRIGGDRAKKTVFALAFVIRRR